MSILNRDKFVKLTTYCIGKELSSDHPIRMIVEEEGKKKNFSPLGAFYLRGLDMDGVIALVQPKKESADGLTHYLFVWFSKLNTSVSQEGAHATLQIKSVDPMRFSLRGKPDSFVKVLGESSMIQSILVDLVDDLKCLEGYTIFNNLGSQKDAIIEIPEDVIKTTFIVQTMVSEEPTSPTHGKLERMEIALPQIIDLANYSIMTGLKMFGPMNEFTNFCEQCGKKLPPGQSSFCIHCGAQLE
ncbi:MAG TPA: zinc ribbon domain-containing protein [candidate division Zixibacteria bacterium]|nr:zinc ribbon domain-containing protein [candidate division Zixibacteria bacterium]